MKDRKTRKVLVPKDGFFAYTDKDDDKIKAKFAKLNKKYKKIAKYHFTTTISVPDDFAPTVVGNFTRGFAGLTMAKMLNQITRDEKKAEEKAAKKSGSKSPGSRSPGSSR